MCVCVCVWLISVVVDTGRQYVIQGFETELKVKVLTADIFEVSENSALVSDAAALSVRSNMWMSTLN